VVVDVTNATRFSAADQIAEAANDFFAAIARGETPSITAYCERYPAIAEHIRRAFPALLLVGDRSADQSTNAQPPLPEDVKTLGDFRLIREIGRGGMGTVFEAEQLSMGRLVALKVLPFAALAHGNSLQRFRNEVRAAAALNHPNIVAVYSVGEERGVHFYAMQLIRGRTLAELIAQRAAASSPSHNAMPGQGGGATSSTQCIAQDGARTVVNSRRDAKSYRMAARLGVQAADALQHAHDQGVLHRDIKPSNLILDSDDTLHVADFGLARIQADAGVTISGDIVGTLRYMPPEQALLKRTVIDHRADIYSLGATLYELLTLQPAFDERDRAELLKQIAFTEPVPLRKLDRRIPAELETIVLKAMAKNPADRYESSEQLADDLRAWLDSRPIKAKPPSLSDRVAKWSQRHKPLIGLAAAALVLIAILQAVSMVMISRAQTQTVSALKESSRLLYAADMNVALQYVDQGWWEEARSVLVRHRPKSGATDFRGWEWYFLNTMTHKPGSSELIGHKGSVNEVAVFPDQERLASVGDDGTVRIWNLRTREQIKVWKLGVGALHSVAISPDGRFVAAGSNILFICDATELSSRPKIVFFAGHNFESLAFRPDGKCIAAGSRYHDVFLVSLAGKQLGRTQCDSRVTSLEFLDDEHLLLLPNRSPVSDKNSVGVAQLWRDDLSAVERELGHVPDGIGGHITVARPWPGGKYILAGETYGAKAEVFDRESGRVLEATHEARGKLCDVAVSPDGQGAAIAFDNGMIEYYHGSSPKGIGVLGYTPAVFKAHGRAIHALRFASPDQLVTCGDDGKIRLWNLADLSHHKHIANNSDLVTSSLSPDGSKVLCVNPKGFRVIDSSTGSVVSKRKLGVAPSGGSAWSNSGNEFAVCLNPRKDATVDIMDSAGESRCSIVHAGSPFAVAFSPNDEFVGVVGDQQLQICDAVTGEEVARQTLAKPGYAIAFSHDGERIAFADNAGQVFFSDAPFLSEQFEVKCESPTICMAFSPDDVILATGHRDGSLRLWDVATGKLGTEYKGYGEELCDILFSPDGRRVVTAATSGNVRIWSLEHDRSIGILWQAFGQKVKSSDVANFHMSMSKNGERLSVGYGSPVRGLSVVQVFDIHTDRSERP
jgi:serine/threonine protein kinase/WD40 repeat protein